MRLTDRDSNEARLAAHRDLFRTVHPDVKEGALRAYETQQAGLAAREDAVRGAAMELTAALEYVDRVCTKQISEVTYETMQRAGFNRKENWRRKYTLADARRDANTAAIRLRNAWELLDPVSPTSQAEAQRTALGNCQTQLQAAIGHLQAVLNKPRTHAEQQAADTAARDWLASIGSEPA